MPQQQPPLSRLYSITLFEGAIYTALHAPGDLINPAGMRVGMSYRPSPKPELDQVVYSTVAATGPFERLPAGDHSLELEGRQPDHGAGLFLNMRSPQASVDVSAGSARHTLFRSASCTLKRGAAQLIIRPVEPQRPPGKPFRVHLTLTAESAFDYEAADYEDNTGTGRKPLKKGENFIQAREQLTLHLSLGECEKLELHWTWLG